jgi:hypothetical protein
LTQNTEDIAVEEKPTELDAVVEAEVNIEAEEESKGETEISALNENNKEPNSEQIREDVTAAEVDQNTVS